MTQEPVEKTSYSQAGVDIEAGARAVELIRAAVRSTYTDAVIGDIGGFGGLYSARAIKAMQDPVLVSATDGVGTKLELARRLGRHSTVGIDLVAMCVNDLVVSGACPLFFLDYLAVGRLDAEQAAELVAGVAEGCRQAEAALIGGEMAEHPGVMRPDDYDLAGFAVGVVERSQMLGPERVQAGDQVIGLASSGLHSNGFSLVRRAWTDKLTDAELEQARLLDGTPLAEALMEPTRIYVKALLSAYAEFGQSVKSAAHITGGGISENLNRALPPGLDAHINLGSWPVPEVVARAVSAAGLGKEDALTTFNMGLGMALVVSPGSLDAGLDHLSAFQPAYHVGSIVPASDSRAPGRVVYGGEALP
jgi:phosphoribosylformylglycinamidine cyclo-ligase